MDVSVFVQTCPQRKELLRPTLDSLEQSDAKNAYRVLEHPPELRGCRFFRTVLETMAAAPTKYVIRLEDDVLVCRHLLHNFLTWPALKDPRFAVGWLYTSEMAWLVTKEDKLGFRTREEPTMPNAFGVGLRTETVKACLAEYDRWLAEYGCGLAWCARQKCRHDVKPRPSHQCGQDTLFSRTAWNLGKRVFLARPAMVESREDVPSVVGTVYPFRLHQGDRRHFRADPHFDAHWRRPA